MNATQVTLETVGGTAIVKAAGEIDVSNAALLTDRFAEIPVDVAKVVIDLSGVTFLDSSGLGALVTLSRKIGATKRSSVVACTLQVAKLIDVTGLSQALWIAPTLDAALEM